MEKKTLGDAAAEYSNKNYAAKDFKSFAANEDWYISWLAFNNGGKWQAERMYSEEEVIKLVDGAFHMYASSHRHDAREWLVEQFKKK